MHLKYMYPKGWRDSSAVTNTLCSQNPHGTHTSVTILLGNLMPSFVRHRYQAHTLVHIHTQTKTKAKTKKIIYKSKNKNV